MDDSGRVLRFDPSHPATASAAALTTTTLLAIACPSNSQCTTLDTGSTSTGVPTGPSRLITFDPNAPDATHAVDIAGLQGTLACPTVSECVASAASTGGEGQTVVLDPTSGHAQAGITRDETTFTDLVCPAASQCTAMDSTGHEVTFDPVSATNMSEAQIDTVGECCTNIALGRIACPTVTRCVVVAQTLGSAEWTFDPRGPGHPATVAIGDAAAQLALACPRARECITLANVTAPFLPRPGLTATAATLDPRAHRNPSAAWKVLRESAGISCPTATQCTIVTPRAPGHRSCPTCSRLSWGHELTFNPRGKPTVLGFKSGDAIDGASLTGISCPTSTQCTAIDTRGRAVTFNPRHPAHRRVARIARGTLTGLDCPTRVECVAVDRTAREIVFDPRTSQAPRRLNTSGSTITGISCPSADECAAIDAGGSLISSDPSGRVRPLARIDTHRLTAISCPTRAFCVAVDQAGRAVEGNPLRKRRWNIERLVGASQLRAVACTSRRLCVTVDSAGHVFTGRSLNR